MSNQPDRPARRPRPAADAGVDPIDYRSVAEPAAPLTRAAADFPTRPVVSAPAARPQGPPVVERLAAARTVGPAVREQTVQLNSRVSADVAAIFDAAAAGFPSKRAALEHAITEAFGS